MTEGVAILAPDMRSGGSVGDVAWRHVLELSRSYRVYPITRDAPIGAHEKVELVVVRPGTWNRLRRYCHVPNELSLLYAMRQTLRCLCESRKIELVWCHSHSATALVAVPLRARFGYRVVMTTHGDIFDRPPRTYSRELTWFYRAVTPRAYREADEVHALSPYMADCAVWRGARRDRVRTIPNGVDPAEIGAANVATRPPASFVRKGRLRLLYVGSLWSVKGVDLLIGAVAELESSQRVSMHSTVWSRGDVVLTLVGDGPQREELERLAKSLGIGERITFAGRVQRRELVRFYQDADMLCIPSLSEAFSLAALEAMACALPVVGSAIGGIPSLVEPGFNGYLATPGDAGSLANCIAMAAVSREHLADLGARGLSRARERFGWDRVGEQLIELAHSVVQRGDPPAP